MNIQTKLILPLITGWLLNASSVFAQVEATEDSSAQAALFRTLIQEAIDLGVPLYNDGQPEACAAVYRIALRSLILFNPSSGDQQKMVRALSTASGQDPERRAWTLRYALDEAYGANGRSSTMDDGRFRIDFTADRMGSWYPVNDNVMGGISRGGFTASGNGTGEFSGQLSLQNNGGFSSVRMPVENAALAGYDGVEMRVRGDDRTYTLLAGPSRARGSWQRNFNASEEWQTIRVPFDAMELSVRGWRPASYPPITGRDVGMLGLLVADKQTRPFRLEIDWIQGFTDEFSDVQ
jgi:NADH dehydrogenase [ubiquinone] 1 alpha subcomplex assembly factor 1